MSQVFQGGVLYINGLPAAHTGPGGHATAPEECWVTVAGQKVKQPFTNMAYSKDLKATASRIFVDGYPVATQASFTSTSYGDEGSEGGVKSGTKQGCLSFLSGSTNVFFEGQPVVRHTDKVILNNENSEITTWVQPAKNARAIQTLLSDPIESLTDAKAVNIQLLRNATYEFEPAAVHQHFLVQHDQTEHKTYHTFGVFKNIDNQYLWHGDFLREGTYTVYEVFAKSGNGLMQVPLGKIHTVEKQDLHVGLKLVPVSFKRYDDMQSSIESAKTLYPDTYLYLFKDRELWREFEINHLGRLYEVDLPYFKHQDARYADGELTQGIFLPIEDAQGQHEFHIAVSHVRWSRAYIDQIEVTRLQKIDIHTLINQGEICSAIPASETQDARARSVHPCEPPQSNREWVVDRDKLQHSTGTQKAENDLVWGPQSPVQGSAICLLHDPLGRLIQTAEFMLNQHCEHSAYVKEYGDIYALAQLVGQVVDTTTSQGKDYWKLVDEEAYNQFIEKYTQKRDAYQAMILEGTEVLKFWYEASFERGQWDDFERITQDESFIPSVMKIYQAIHENIYAAFMLSPEGLAYLQEEVKKTNSRILASGRMSAQWLSVEYSTSLYKNTLTLMASVLEEQEASLKKMVDFYEKSIGETLPARTIQVLESELANHHKMMMLQSDPPVSTTLRIAKGSLTPHRIDLDPKNSGRTIRVIEFDGIPAQKLQPLVKPLERAMLGEEGKRLKDLATRTAASAPLRIALSALVLFNTRGIIQQIDQLKTQGDLEDGTFIVLHAEVIRNILVVSELSAETLGIMTRTIATRKLSAKALLYAGRLSLAGIAAGLIVDVIYLRKYLKSGENELLFSHGLSAISAIATLISLLNQTLLASRWLGLLGVSLAFIAGVLILYFTKNDIEKWLFHGYWGKTDDEKDRPKHSIEKFHLMTSTVHVLDFNGLDVNNKPTLRYHPDHHSNGLYGEMGIPSYIKPAKDLVWKFSMFTEPAVMLKVSVWVMTPSGLELLNEKYLSYLFMESTPQATVWKLQYSRHHFPVDGLLGRVHFQTYDAQTQAFISKDAYEFSHEIGTNRYHYKKVLYDLHD